MSAAAIHQLLNLPPSTIHRALTTLEEEGFITRYRGQSKYVIGPNPQHLAHALFSLFPMRRAFHSLLRGVAVAQKQTLLLTMRLGWYGLKVAVFEGTNEVFHAGALGETRLLNEDEAGQAMLGAMGAAELSGMRDFLERHWPGCGKSLAGERTPQAVPAAGVDAQRVEPVVDQAGWAWHHVPVCDAAARVIAAVSGGAPGDAGSVADAQARSRGLADAVTQIEARLRVEPELAWSPFEHLSPDEILLRGRPAGA